MTKAKALSLASLCLAGALLLTPVCDAQEAAVFEKAGTVFSFTPSGEESREPVPDTADTGGGASLPCLLAALGGALVVMRSRFGGSR